MFTLFEVKENTMQIGILVLFAYLNGFGSSPSSMAAAWMSCSEETGGGTCPDETTCCPTGKPGASACIPLVHTNGPIDKPKGQCCGDSLTGCRFGYECATSSSSASRNAAKIGRLSSKRKPKVHPRGYCKATNETLSMDPTARDTPRYDLCHIQEDMKKYYGFPIAISRDLANRNISAYNAVGEDEEVFHLPYLSNIGPISPDGGIEVDNGHEDYLKTVRNILIIVHGSLRDAEDYFCTGLSLIEGSSKNISDGTMVVAPKFLSINDDMSKHESLYRFLVWDDQVEAYDDFLWHIWRYGADAANAPISSYTALDRLVEHFEKDINHFPNLQQITVAGHSAGGQTLQRWALLSNSPAWKTMNIRVVVANARSYAYLDVRRWFPPLPGDDQNTNGKEVFRRPVPEDGIGTNCPWYNHWLWGLEDGGEVACPYRDNAVLEAGSIDVIAKRYATRNVVYLSGEYDTIPQPNDRCGNALQGINRHERAVRFYHGLQEYFGYPIHQFYTIPYSNHDHSLMFQSQLGREAIFGSTMDSSQYSSSSSSSPRVRTKHLHPRGRDRLAGHPRQ